MLMVADFLGSGISWNLLILHESRFLLICFTHECKPVIVSDLELIPVLWLINKLYLGLIDCTWAEMDVVFILWVKM
jgi:hypothetical protein